MAAVGTLELTLDEVEKVLGVVRTRLVDLERALQNVEEGEGFDATKWQARRTLEPQIDDWRDLVLKLEGLQTSLRAKR